MLVSRSTPSSRIAPVNAPLSRDGGEAGEHPAHAPARVLLVDDDSQLRELIASYLAKHNIAVTQAANGMEMDGTLARERFDLIILDLMMPGEDGLSVIRRMRAAARPPIIMLSAMGGEADRIIGLEVGADDYIAKPCNPRELLARVRAVLRRQAVPTVEPMQHRRFGAWVLDLIEREVIRDGLPAARLTDSEFRVLTVFLDRPKRVLSRDQLLDATRSIDSDVHDRAIDVTISRLRKKLGADDPIRTLRGEGYMFTIRENTP